MQNQEFIDFVKGRRGQFIRLNWRRTCEIASAHKKAGKVVEKETVVTVRTGLEYDNLASTVLGRALGTLPPDNAGLQWGVWVKGLYPYIIEHKGQFYARIYSAANAMPKVTWYLNTAVVDKETALTYLRPSDAEKERNRLACFDCFTVKMADLIVTNAD